MNITFEMTRSTIDGSAMTIGVDQYVPAGCEALEVANLTRQALDAYKVVTETQAEWARAQMTPEQLAHYEAIERQMKNVEQAPPRPSPQPGRAKRRK